MAANAWSSIGAVPWGMPTPVPAVPAAMQSVHLFRHGGQSPGSADGRLWAAAQR